MIQLTDFSRTRNSEKRTYTAGFKVDSRDYKLLIEEWYLYTGVEYRIKIKELNIPFLKRLTRPRGFPQLTDNEWYHLYFQQSNARDKNFTL